MKAAGDVMRKHHHGRGTAIIYVSISLVALCGVISLGVDFGRVQVARAELQTAADAAARYAVAGMKNEINGVSAALAHARIAALENPVDGQVVNIEPGDVEIGVWNASNRTFTVNSNVAVANAVRVTLYRNAARNNPIPLTFARILGRSTHDIAAQAVAVINYSAAANAGAGGGRFDYYIPATSNPWLSGMPSGTIANKNNPANNPDYAGTEFTDDGKDKKSLSIGTGGSSSSDGSGANTSNWAQWGDYAAKKSSPIRAGSIPVNPGSTLMFDSVNGGANNFASSTLYTGDGNTGWVIDNWGKNENGMSNLRAPINSVVAVFLSNADPRTQGTTPPALDFSSAASRDFHTLKPQLRQVFFIGDGRRSNGEVQRFVVPPGATRLYIGTMDGWEWNNNVGGFNVSTYVTGSITLVR
jgi:Flp pilus assembly protein TadG